MSKDSGDLEGDKAWTSVWKLYLENDDVFRGVFAALRRRGFHVEEQRTSELIHEFLLTRASAALRTFRPERGHVKGWLFVVFRRFVHGTLADEARREARRAILDDRLAAPPESGEQSADVEAARKAIEALPPDERAAVRAYLAPAETSVRSVARALGISRFRAEKLISRALERLEQQLGSSSSRR